MSNGDIVIPPTDLTSAAIEAVNLILSQLGLSPLDAILSLFSGKPKFDDTNAVIAAYQQSAYWPLHALASDMQIWEKNGAPISDSNPAVQASFGVAKQGTVESIQQLAGEQPGPGSPGYWTIFALIQGSWGASGYGEQQVLKYVKALDALTQVLTQQNTKPPPPPPPPPPPSPPPGGGGGGNGDLIQELIACLCDETSDECCAAVVAAISSVVQQLAIIAKALTFGGKPVGPPQPPIDLTPIVNAVEQLVAAVGAIAPGPPVDLTPLVDAVNQVATAIADGPAIDVTGIVDQLKTANTMDDVLPIVLQTLQSIVPIDSQAFGLLQGSPYATVKTVIDWIAEHDPANVLSKAVYGWIKNHPDGVQQLKDAVTGFIKEVFAAGIGAAGDIFTPFTSALLQIHRNEIAKLVNVQPGQEIAGAATLLTEAIGAGVGAHFAAVLAEMAYPTKNLGLPSLAALMSEMAGFGEIMKGIIGPEVAQAISVPHTYYINRQARAHLPTAGQAVEMYSRRKITPAQLDELMGFAGINQNWVDPITSIAYRPMSPMMLAAGFANADIDMAALQSVLEYMGIRPQDLPLAEQAIVTRSLQQTRQALVNEAVTAYGQGVVSDAELQQILTDASYGKAASALVRQRALIARRITLARESESFVVPEVTAGLLTPGEGAQALEAAGVEAWQADLKMTLAQTKQALTAARKAAAAERRLEIQRQREATRVAIASYETGTIDDGGLTAALIAIGLDPVLVGSVVAVEAAKRAGRIKLVYGQLLTPAKAKVLTEQVAALEGQFKKQLIDEANLRAQLSALNIDSAELNALVARWAAARTAATKTGYVLPV
jgi:hypothetical protein